MVDDPYTFGQIAATNSLSDIYAMGATPTTAMNLICFPTCLPVSVMGEISGRRLFQGAGGGRHHRRRPHH